MGVRTSVTYNGKMLDPFKFRIEHLPDMELSLREFDLVHVEGRVGDIAVDNKTYKNKKRRYSISFASTGAEDFSASCSEISKWLEVDGYAELRDTYDPNYFYLAVPSGNPTVSSILNGRAGKVTIEFSCIPKKFLRYGEQSFVFYPLPGLNAANEYVSTNNLWLYNPTIFDSKPRIIVEFKTGNNLSDPANIEIRIAKDSSGSPYKKLTIKYAGTGVHKTRTMFIDCEMESAFYDGFGVDTIANSRIVLNNTDFPIIYGNSNNKIRIEKGCDVIESITVIPRFWVR